MNAIETILDLAAQLPSGLNDPRAAQKLYDEQHELEAALRDGDTVGALTEAADMAYYAVKAIQYAANLCGITVGQVLAVAVAKYGLRARPGNPKDDVAERVAVSEVLNPTSENLFLSLIASWNAGDRFLVKSALKQKQVTRSLKIWQLLVLQNLANGVGR